MADYKPLKRFSGTRRVHDRQVRTVCHECAAGCGLVAYVKDGRIVDVHGQEDHPISRGKLCAKGIAFVQGLVHPDRITLPATRNRLQGPFEAMDNWEKGLDIFAERLRRVRDQHGPESLIIGCDPEAGLDFYLGALRFAHLWGTPHVYHPLDEPGTQLNRPASPCSDWIHSRCLFLIEADLAVTHPVVFARVLEARERGVKIIAADTRFTTTMSKADMVFVIKPETGNLLGLALMKMMIEENLYHPEATAGFADSESWLASFENLSLENTEAVIGLSETKIRELSRLLGTKPPVTLITGKRLAYQSYYGIWPTMGEAMKWTHVRGGGWYPLESGHPMLNPVRDISEEVETQKPKLESYPYQISQGRDISVKAMIGSGNCLNDFFSPFRERVRDMDFVAYFGAFPNITRDLAHMVFPAALWPERYGICFSNDRAIQWGEKIVEPSDACRSGLGLWIRLAQRFGWEEHFPWTKENGLADHRAFYTWLLHQSPDTEGCPMDRLFEHGDMVFWPVHAPESSGKTEPTHGPEAIKSPSAQEDEETYPLCFQSTRMASRSRDASYWWPWTRELEHEDEVQIHPQTAHTLKIENGDEVRISGPEEKMEAQVRITRMVPTWMIWSPRRFRERRVSVEGLRD